MGAGAGEVVAGVLHGTEDDDASEDSEEILVEGTLEEGIALALEMCPDGESIEIHEPWCDVTSCTCVPHVIKKPVRASA